MNKSMAPKSMLYEAQMHMECINEAFCELEMKAPDEARQKMIWHELNARVWAAIYLVQAANNPDRPRPARFDEVLREANAHNGIMDEEVINTEGMH